MMCTLGYSYPKRTDVLPQDLVKSRSRDIRVKTFAIALLFDRYTGNIATDLPAKFQNDMIITTSNLAAPRLHGILR